MVEKMAETPPLIEMNYVRNLEIESLTNSDLKMFKNNTLSKSRRFSIEKHALLLSNSFADLGHEVKNAMLSVIGYIDVLHAIPNLRKEDQIAIKTIKISAESVLAITDGLLDVGRAGSGGLVLNQDTFRLKAFVDDTMNIMAILKMPGRVELGSRIASNTPRYVVGDKVRLRQILQNLIGNSLKFTHEGHVTLLVERAEEMEGGVRFTVIDTGSGLSRDAASRLFTRFAETKGGDKLERSGAGLGLAISQSLAILMGGRICAGHNTRGETTFTFAVPLARKPIRRRPRPLRIAFSAMPAEILLAEDVDIYRESLSALLRAHGHRVDIAEDGITAIEKLKAKTYDLVLMDVRLPRLNGIDATRAIRNLDNANASVPIFALTASTGRELIKAALGAGMSGIMSKPVDIVDLLKTVDRVMPERHHENHILRDKDK